MILIVQLGFFASIRGRNEKGTYRSKLENAQNLHYSFVQHIYIQ